MVKIIKASGREEVFRKKYIEESAIRAGASRKLAKEVANKVSQKVHKRMTTEQILDLTLKYLGKERPGVAARYDLKRAIMTLGPHGFLFEEFFSQVLKAYGYKTSTGNIVKGKVVSHEVDIIAEKKLRHMIEAKYHNRKGVYTDTKVTMYTHARFLDIQSNPRKKFDSAWLVTNTKCTSRAVKYARGVNLKIIGWKYPSKGNLQELIEKKELYPITIFKSVSEHVKDKLFKAKIVLAKDLVTHDMNDLIKKTGLKEHVLRKVFEEYERVLLV
ncbi:hypothetical protein HOD75_00685 [archaeon]|jgi:hypothetical protein|nr:hypothetical protein [archaeon]MBT4241392.1 hypothetical protein [archaeon]MBT4418213.1 hypothetical protein [archaeon]